jgi:hypothetical protein
MMAAQDGSLRVTGILWAVNLPKYIAGSLY